MSLIGAVLALARQGDPQDGQELFLLGDDFMPWMVLAFGAALVAGNLMALLRPPKGVGAERGGQRGAPRGAQREAPPERPPLARTVVMIVIGAVAALWGLVTLLN